MKRKLSALLVLFTLMSTIISCGSSDSNVDNAVETTASETGADTSNEASDASSEELPNYLTLEENFGGKEFRILAMDCTTHSQFSIFEVYAEAENGEVVNDAVFNRNMTIEEKFNVHITEKRSELKHGSGTSNYFVNMQNMLLSGENSFDMFFLPMRDMASFIANNYSVDLYSLPYIDFDEDYWYEETSNKSLSIGGKLYLTNSDLSLQDKGRTAILVYNRDMFHEYSDDVMEDMVYDGTWVFDRIVEYWRMVSADLNGDGILNNYDQWGVGMDSPAATTCFAVGMGGQLVGKDNDDNFVITALEPRMIDIVDKIFAALNTEKTNGSFVGQYGWAQEGVASSSIISHMFKSGQMLFMTTYPHMLKSYSSGTDFDYGVMAWPKYDENQEHYYSRASNHGSLFGIPITNTDHDFAGFMLEVLSGYSTDTSLNAYREVSCKVKYTYDETSAGMLDICFDNIIYDVGMIYDWSGLHTDTFRALLKMPSNTYVSKVEAIMDAVEIQIEELLDAVE